MSSTLGFSSFESDEPINKQIKRTRARTIKKKRGKVESFLKSMGDSTHNEEENEEQNNHHSASERGDGADLASFHPPPKPVLTKTPDAAKPIQSPPDPHMDQHGILKEGMTQNNNYYDHLEKNQYYNPYTPSYTGTRQNIPYYSQLANSQDVTGPKDELMHKLNYLIHLLEEQKDEKTGNVTEELVLYMFLGVFVIFVVDSFARTGRYTR